MIALSSLQHFRGSILPKRNTITCCSSTPSSQTAPFWQKEEAHSLIALCQDLDWESRAAALRQQALRYEQQRESSRSPSNNAGELKDVEWDLTDAVLRLRRQASTKVAEELAEKLQAPPDLMSKLTSYIMEEACKQAKVEYQENSQNWGNAAVTLLMLPILGIHGTAIGSALANEATTEATKAAPSWLTPVILGIPVGSYVLFNIYRDKVNPYAKATDWLFGMGAIFIIGNLLTIAAFGVRLY